MPGYGAYIGIDSSESLHKKAKNRTKFLLSVNFLKADISAEIPIATGTADVVIANMVLQYVTDLAGVCKNAVRLLSKHGVFIITVDHPSHALFVRAQELAGKKNAKFIDIDSYFSEGKRRKRSLWDQAILTYYHRTIAGYINSFVSELRLDQIDEVSEDNEMPRILGLKFIKA